MHAVIAVIGTLRFAPEQLAELLPHIQALVEATRRHDGCIAYDIALDPFDAGLLHVSELWPDPESFARHMVAPHIEPWRAAVSRCGLLERNLTAYDVTGARAV